MTTATQPMTLIEFLALPNIDESPAWEYIDGVATQKLMGGGKHSTLQKRLVSMVDQASSQYEAFPELRCTFGNRSIIPDVSIVERDRLPLDQNGDIASSGLEFAPAWVIEILSPSQSQTKVTGNILHCLKNGCRLAWLIDPQERLVLVYQPDQLPELLSATTQLPVLTEMSITLTVEQLWTWLRRS